MFFYPAYYSGFPHSTGSLVPNRRVFTSEEDQRLKELVSVHGESEWKTIAAMMGNRTARQCRERYKNYLHPDVVNGCWQPEEELLLRAKYAEIGPKWALMTPHFPGRSSSNIKNHWAVLTAHNAPGPGQRSRPTTLRQ
jgi:hypothetical protein